MPRLPHRGQRTGALRDMMKSLTWLSIVLVLCWLATLATSATAASVYPPVAICNLDTQVYVSDAPVDRVVSFWLNASDCTDVDNALVAGSIYVSPPDNDTEAATNTVTIQFPSWSVNWPLDYLVVCARVPTNTMAGTLSLSQATVSDDDTSEAAVTASPHQYDSGGDSARLEATLIWPPVPLRDLLMNETPVVNMETRSAVTITATAASTVTFIELGNVSFYDLYHAPLVHRLSAFSPSDVDEAVFYVGLRERVTSGSTEASIMMPSFCANAACENTGTIAGRELTAAEAEYVLSVLAHTTAYVFPSLVANTSGDTDNASDACGALYRQYGTLNFTVDGQLVPTANLSVELVTDPSTPSSSGAPRWRIAGTFTNLTSDQYADGVYPLCVSPAFIYLSAADTLPPVQDWSSAQGEAMAGLTTLLANLFSVTATSALASATQVLWDVSAVLTVEAGSTADWPADSTRTAGYAVVVGATSAACSDGTVLFAGSLLSVSGDAARRQTPRLRFGPSALDDPEMASEVVATAAEWNALFADADGEEEPTVTLSVCLALDNETTSGTDAGSTALSAVSTWAGTVTLRRLFIYAATVLLPPSATATATATDDVSLDFSACVVPPEDAFATDATMAFFMATSTACTGTRYTAPDLRMLTSMATTTAATNPIYTTPEPGVAYVLCLQVNTTFESGSSGGGTTTVAELVAATSPLTSGSSSVQFMTAPNVTSVPSEVYFDTPFTIAISLDEAATGTDGELGVVAIPATETCESPSCPPDPSFTPTVLGNVATLTDSGTATVVIPASAGAILGDGGGTVRLCLSTPPAISRNFSLVTVLALAEENTTTTTTTTTTSTTTTTTTAPIVTTNVYPTTVVKGQAIILHSMNLQSGNANLAYDPYCNQLLFSPALTIQSGKVSVTVPLCSTINTAYYCERQSPSYPYAATALMDVVTLYNCTVAAPVNLLPITVPPATPVVSFGVDASSTGTITNTTPFLSQVSDCSVTPSMFAQAVQMKGYTTALGELIEFYVCMTSRDGTLNFTNTAYGPTLTIAPFELDPDFAALGVEVTSAQLTPAVPVPDSTFVIRGITGNGWDGIYVSNSITSIDVSMNWTSAVCNVSVPDSQGQTRMWWSASGLGRGEVAQFLSPWGTDIADVAGYYANLGQYYVCSNRTETVTTTTSDETDESFVRVPLSTFIEVAPPLVEWLTPAIANGYSCARLLVPGGWYSLMSQSDGSTGTSWSQGVYLMPTTASDYAAAVDAHTNLCAQGPFMPNETNDTLREGYSNVANMTSDLTDVVCIPAANLTVADDALYLVCSGTPAGYQQTNETTTVTALNVTPETLTGGATVTMTVPAWPSTTFTFTPSAVGCAAVPDGMPTFTTDSNGVGVVTLIVISSSLGIPSRALDEGSYLLCHELTWQSPPSLPASASAPATAAASTAAETAPMTTTTTTIGSARAGQTWVTRKALAPLGTVHVHDAIFYDISTHALAVNVTSSVFLLLELTTDVLKPGFYSNRDCSDESAVSTDLMNWTAVTDTGASSTPQLQVLARGLPRNVTGGISSVYLCAFTSLNQTYQPVPNNNHGIRVIDQPFYFADTVHPCEQLNVFFEKRKLLDENTASVQLVDGPCCDPDAPSWMEYVQEGTRLERFYRSFLLNDSTLSAIAPTTSLTVCTRFHVVLSNSNVESAFSCMTAGVVTALTSASYCGVNPGVLPYLTLAPREDIYGSGVQPTLLKLTWGAVIAIAVVAGVVLIFLIVIMIVGCVVKRHASSLKGEPDLAEALAQSPPMWKHVDAPSTTAEAEAAAERKKTQPERTAKVEQDIVDHLQSQLLPAMSPKQVSECLSLSLRGSPHAMNATPPPSSAYPTRSAPLDSSYDPVARYLGTSSSSAASPAVTVPIDATADGTTASVLPSSTIPAESSVAAPKAAEAPETTKSTEPQTKAAAAAPAARRVVSAPSPSVSPTATTPASQRKPPMTPLQETPQGPLADLEAEEALARAGLEEDEDDALYHVLETERCRWRDLMAGEGVRLKTLLEQDPFWSSRLAMLESLNARALARAEQSTTRDRSGSTDNGGATDNRISSNNNNNDISAAGGPGVWGEGRAHPPPPPPHGQYETDDDDGAFSTPSGVMTPLSETVLVFPTTRDGGNGAQAAADAHKTSPVAGDKAATSQAGPVVRADEVPDVDGLLTMHSQVSEASGADDALDLDESLFSSASGGGSADGKRRRLTLLQTPEASGQRGPPPAALPGAAQKPAIYRDPHQHVAHDVEYDDGLYSDVSGGDSDDQALHPPRWTPPPPPPLQQPEHQQPPPPPPPPPPGAGDDTSEFSDVSAHASVPRGPGEPRRATNVPSAGSGPSAYAQLDMDAMEDGGGDQGTGRAHEAMANPLPPPTRPVLPADGADETEGTASSGTGLLYSPASGNRRMTVPRAAVSPSARPRIAENNPAARELSWSPPSAMGSVPRGTGSGGGGGDLGAPPPASASAAAPKPRKKGDHYDNPYLDEM